MIDTSQWEQVPQGTRVEIGRARKDHLYPVRFIFTGRTITKLMTWEEAMLAKGDK